MVTRWLHTRRTGSVYFPVGTYRLKTLPAWAFRCSTAHWVYCILFASQTSSPTRTDIIQSRLIVFIRVCLFVFVRWVHGYLRSRTHLAWFCPVTDHIYSTFFSVYATDVTDYALVCITGFSAAKHNVIFHVCKISLAVRTWNFQWSCVFWCTELFGCWIHGCRLPLCHIIRSIFGNTLSYTFVMGLIDKKSCELAAETPFVTKLGKWAHAIEHAVSIYLETCFYVDSRNWAKPQDDVDTTREVSRLPKRERYFPSIFP